MNNKTLKLWFHLGLVIFESLLARSAIREVEVCVLWEGGGVGRSTLMHRQPSQNEKPGGSFVDDQRFQSLLFPFALLVQRMSHT